MTKILERLRAALDDRYAIERKLGEGPDFSVMYREPAQPAPSQRRSLFSNTGPGQSPTTLREILKTSSPGRKDPGMFVKAHV